MGTQGTSRFAAAILLAASPLAQEPSASTEDLVFAALADDDWQVRHAATCLIEQFGTAEQALALRPLLDDARREVRKRAWRAWLAVRPHDVSAAFDRVAECAAWDDELALLFDRLQRVVRPEHAEQLVRAFEESDSVHARYAFMALGAQVGAELMQPAAEYLRACESPQQVENASLLLPLVPGDADHRDRVLAWLAHGDRKVRHRCATWLVRQGVQAPQVAPSMIPDFVERWQYEGERRASGRALGESWTPVARETLLAAVRAARCTIVADLHGAEDIKRLTVELLEQVVSTSPNHVALGYEAPVRRFLDAVLSAASRLGAAAVALEEEELAPSTRTRDAIVNARMAEWLERSPGRRMVVLYGDLHLLGDGHIGFPGAVQVLTCGAPGLLRHISPEALAAGTLAGSAQRYFVHPERPDVFVVLCDAAWQPRTRAAFCAWLQRRLVK